MSVDIRHPLKKLIPILLKAKEENLNEADTVQRLMMVFQDVLGYDPLTEITREMPIKTKYVDLALKIDGVIKLLVEAKAAGSDLRDRHIEQAKSYAAESNIRWVVLTNGVNWNGPATYAERFRVYHSVSADHLRQVFVNVFL